MSQQNENNICQECGMMVQPKEFHPFEFCVLWKNGLDPRKLCKQIESLAKEVSHD